MPNTSPKPRRRPSRLTEIKWFIATLSVAATLGFWTLFARQWVRQVAANSVPQDTPDPTQPDNTLTMDLPTLPPLPTLIPTFADLPVVVAPQAAMAPVASVVTPVPTQVTQAPSAPASGKILLGGSAPSSNNNSGNNNRPRKKSTTTRTHSSH